MVGIVHAHVPKTAGSAFNRQIIYNNFQKEEIFHAYDERLMKRRTYNKDLRTQVAASKVAVGHVPYGFFSAVSGDVIYLSLFRDPIDRMVSFLNFITNEAKNGVWALLPEKLRAPAREDPNVLMAALYADPELRHSISDLQVRYACGLGKFGLPGVAVDPFHRELALHCVSNPDYRVGLHEEYDAFCKNICDELGMKFSRAPNFAYDVGAEQQSEEVKNRLLKIFDRKVTKNSLNATSMAMITEMNAQDLRFYEQLGAKKACVAAA